MKKISLLLAVIMVLVSLAACAKAGDTQPAETQEVPDNQIIGTDAPESIAAETNAPETTAETAASAVAEESTLPESISDYWYEISDDKGVLTITLDANPTTGYMWTYKISDDKVLELITDEFIAPEDNGMVGVGGQWVASFKPTGAKDGDVTLTFMYGRSWEKEPAESKELRIIVQGNQLAVIDQGYATRTQDVLEDGTTKVSVDSSLLEHEGEGVMGYVQIMKPVVLTDETVQKLKAGDSVSLSQYGLEDLFVEEFNKKDDSTIDIGNGMLMKKDELGGWIISGLDDDVASYVDRDVFVKIPDNVEFEDQMGQIVFSGEKKFDTFWEAAQEYRHFDAEFSVEDGMTTKVIIFYHP